MEKNFKEQIQLFIDEAKRLKSKSFYEFCINNEVIVSDGTISEVMPDEEQLEAYVLHFRKFIQNNDSICVSKIANLVNKYLYENKKDTSHWNKLYDTYKNMFKSKSLLNNFVQGIEVSVTESIDSKIYGDLAHLNKEKRELYNKLTDSNLKNGLFRLELYDILFDAGEIIVQMAEYCEELMQAFSRA